MIFFQVTGTFYFRYSMEETSRLLRSLEGRRSLVPSMLTPSIAERYTYSYEIPDNGATGFKWFVTKKS